MNAVAQPAVAPAAPLDLSFAMEPPISVRGVDKRYDGQTVLAGANLQLEPGERQRVAIARALVNNPRIVLADEPTGNLDSDSAEKVYDIMRDINERYNTTFLIITHDRRIAQKADRIIEIKDGRIYLDLPNRLAGKSGEETA